LDRNNQVEYIPLLTLVTRLKVELPHDAVPLSVIGSKHIVEVEVTVVGGKVVVLTEKVVKREPEVVVNVWN